MAHGGSHRGVESVGVPPGPRRIRDPVLIPHHLDAAAPRPASQLVGERRLCAAHEVEEVERLRRLGKGLLQVQELHASAPDRGARRRRKDLAVAHPHLVPGHPDALPG